MSIKTSLKKINLLLVVVVLCGHANALKVGDFNVPDKINIEKKTLLLNGSAYRKVTAFKVKVWLSALYLETLSSNSEDILNSKTIKAVDLYPMYEISARDSVKGWQLAFDDNCDSKCAELKPEIQKFLAAVPDFKKKDNYRYEFTEHGVDQFINEKLIFKSTNLDFSKLLLSTWIGKKPPTDEVKKGLLSDTH